MCTSVRVESIEQMEDDASPRQRLIGKLGRVQGVESDIVFCIAFEAGFYMAG